MRRPRSTDAAQGPAVLVPQTSFLGDVVLTTPLLDALRARIGPRRLSVMVRPEAVALVDGHGAVDEVLIDDKYGRDRGVRGLWRQAQRLREARFDLAVAPHRSLRTALLLAMAGIPRRVGFDASRGAWLYHECVHRDRRLHDVDRNLALAAIFDGEAPAVRVHVPVAERARQEAARLLDGRTGPLVGIAPSSVWPTKRWTETGFARVIDALASDGVACVLIGGPNDRPITERVRALARTPVLDLCGQTDLATFVAVVDRLTVLVANDSAPMHVATARGVPVVAVFCATTPALGYGPYGPNAVVIEADLDCRPCARHGGRRCPRGTEDCRHLVQGEEVAAAVRRLLGDATSAREGAPS